MRKLIVIFTLISLMGVGCGTTKKEKEKSAQSSANNSVEAQIRMKLKSDPLTAPYDIKPSVDGNTVTLNGMVEKEDQRRRAEDLSREIVGELRKVNNQIKLTDEVILDKTLIARVSTQLLSNPITRLSNIDVQSKNGVVTLNGKVQSEEQKREAERVAKDAEGVKGVENHLTVSP